MNRRACHWEGGKSTTSAVPTAQGCQECQPSNEHDLLSQTCPQIAGQKKHIWKPAHWKDRNGHYLMPEIFWEQDQKHLLWEEMREEMACYSEKERERERSELWRWGYGWRGGEGSCTICREEKSCWSRKYQRASRDKEEAKPVWKVNSSRWKSAASPRIIIYR